MGERLRGAIYKRGLVNSSNDWGSGLLTYRRAAEIFIYFLRDKILRLREYAK